MLRWLTLTLRRIGPTTKLRFRYSCLPVAADNALCVRPAAVTGWGDFITVGKCHGTRKNRFLSSNGTNFPHRTPSSVLIILQLREEKSLRRTFLTSDIIPNSLFQEFWNVKYGILVRHYDTSWKVAGSRPDKTNFSICLILPSALGPGAC
jgi:hypothetical protein